MAGHSKKPIVAVLRWAGLFACLALFVHAMAHADLPAAWRRIVAIGPVAAIILVPFPLGLLADTAAWRLLLMRLGRNVPLSVLYRTRLSVEAIANTAPAGAVWAEAVGPMLVAKQSEARVSDVVAASTARRWLLVRMHGIYVTVSAVLGFSAITAASTALLGGRHGLFLMVIGGALALLTLAAVIEGGTSKGRVAERLADFLARWPRIRKWIEDREAHFTAADESIAKLSADRHTQLGALVRIAGLWLAEGLETFLILRLLGADLTLIEVLSFDAALSIVRSAAFFAPAGIGVQDVGYLTVLQAYGVPDAQAIGPAFVVLKRLKEIVFIGIGYVLFAAAKPRQRAQVAEM